jgi:hypothetical protein
VVSVSPPPPAAPLPDVKIAVFVKNQTRTAGMDDMADSLRDRIAAELSAAGMSVMDSDEVASAFYRYKVTTAEERAGLIDGLFRGGSAVRVAQMLGADYLLTASILSADRASVKVGTSTVNTYTLRMSVKVSDAAQGASVYGDTWSRKVPVPASAAGTDSAVYYNDLFDAWAAETGPKIAQSSRTWRAPAAPSAQLATFTVSTTIDELIRGLEEGVRAPNELLDEMRRVIGGATVEIDGAVVGSAPGSFKVAPGLHQMRVSRAWMEDWQGTVNIQEGGNFRIALELSSSGLQRFQTMEKLRAHLAMEYAEAMAVKGIKINFDTAAWRDVAVGNQGGNITEIRQQGTQNNVRP